MYQASMAVAPSRRKTASNSERPRHRDESRPWYRFAARLLPCKTGRWVDLGCGQAEFLEIARRSGAATGIALDLSPHDAVAGVASVVADLRHPLPFGDQSLDGASMIEVIEHITTAEGLVDELARVIRKDGWLIITTPNVAHLTYRWRALTGHPPKQEGYHYRFFTKKTLRHLFESRGFRISAHASFGKQAILTKLLRMLGKERGFKFRYRVPVPFESLLAQHFVWRLVRTAALSGASHLCSDREDRSGARR